MHKKLISTLMVATMITGNVPVILASTPSISQQENGITVLQEESVATRQIVITDNLLGQTCIVTPYKGYGSELHKKYAEVYQATGIKSYKNNGGQFNTSSLDKAFDGTLDSHWETGRQNDSNFKNEVIVTFDEVEELNRIIYAARKDASNKGFAEEFSIYSSLTEDGEDFKLVARGNATKQSGAVEIKFQKTQFKRLKFVFDKASEGYASASELNFFREDNVLDEVNQIFTNGLMIELSPKYQDKQILGAFLEKLKVHPMAEQYKGLIDIAYRLMNGEEINKDTVMNLPQKGNETKERNRTKIAYALYAHEPTGIFLSKGETLKVYVDADAKGVLPEIVVGLGDFIKLVPGYNEIKLPDHMPGPSQIYMANRAYPSEQAYAPSVRIEGGSKYPVYIHGKTDPVEFMNELKAYVESGITTDFNEFKEGNADGKRANFTVLSSDNILIETSALGAYKGLTQQLEEKGKYADYTIEVYEDMYREYAKYSGFDYELNPERPWNMRPLGKFILAGSHTGPYGWAQHGFTGYNGGGGNRDSGFWVSLPQSNAVETGGWAIYHEVGHTYDSSLLTTQESTNNLYSLHMQDKYLDENRMVQEDRWNTYFTKYHNTKQYPNDDLLFLGAITYQLELVFGDNIYGDAQRLARENKDNWTEGMNNKQRHAVGISMGLGINILPHYEYYGIEMNDKARSLVADLPVLDLKTYYVNDKVQAKDAIAFTDSNVKPTIKASGTGEVTLRMSIDQPDNALLVYELFRDGEYLGVTYGNTFVDKAPIEGMNHVYTVKAYDRKLNVSLESDPVIKNASEPKLSTIGDIVIPVHTEFNPLDYIKATDNKGVDITNNIQVVSNEVNPSVKGVYTVEYAVTDGAGNTSHRQCEVRVVSDMAYLSDLTPVSKQGYYRQDTDHEGGTISLPSENGEVEYTKGIGAHANTTVVYELQPNTYDFFEAYIGLDNAVREQGKSSVTFEVWADSEKVYESDIIKAEQDKEFVRIPLEGVKKLKLVTTNAGDGNSYDHAMWADAKLVNDIGRPELEIGEDAIVVKVGEGIDLLEGVRATDKEDGDLTESIQVNTNGFAIDQPGIYDIIYTITDLDNNTTSKIKQVTVYNDEVYASDVEYTTKVAGWNGIKNDKAPSGSVITILVDGEETEFEKGIGAHAASEIEFDVENTGYFYFHSFIGVDKNVRENKASSVKFRVLADGQEVLNSKTFYNDTDAEEIFIPLEGVSKLTLITDKANGAETADHAVWAGASFLTTDSNLTYTNPNSRAQSELNDLIKEMSDLSKEEYTEESWVVFVEALSQAEEVLANEHATQDEIQDSINALEEAKSQLVLVGDKGELEALVSECYTVDNTKYTEESWVVFAEALSQAEEVLANEHATQDEIQESVSALEKAKSQLILVGDKGELEALVSECYAVDNTKYTEESWVVFAEALSQAEEVLANEHATQDEIQESVSALEKAKSQLALVGDKGELRELIQDVEGMDKQIYSNWNMVEDALGQAWEVLFNADATQEAITNAVELLNQAVAGLEEHKEVKEDVDTSVVDLSQVEAQLEISQP